MSTNYYAVKKEPSVHDRMIHIGKTSVGWKFNFHDCEQFHSFPEFQKFLEEHVDTGEYIILDEYERKWSSKQMLEIIESFQDEENDENFDFNTKNVGGYRFTEGDFC